MPKRPKNVKSAKKSIVVATSQVSRFHTETLETLSNDINLKQVNVSVGDKDLLVDTDLQLFNGVHYGLIGANGTGKTTLLKCIGYKTMTGFPSNVRSLYVEQLLSGLELDLTAVQAVMTSDRERVELVQDAKILEQALESADDDEISESVHKIQLNNQKKEFKSAQKTAMERSGARGADARKILNRKEGELNEMERLTLKEPTAADKVKLVAKAQELLNDINEKLSIYDSEEVIEANARDILSGLGFDNEMQNTRLKHLSGGWRIRISLASALIIKPDILLLDEPTNHLDLPAILWLQTYIKELLNTTILLVSHDRAFLNAAIDEVIVLKNKTLRYYKGNYDEYFRNFEERQVYLQTMADSINKKKTAAQKSIDKSSSIAHKSGDDKKLAAVASKKKKMDRLGMEVNSKGHRFKLNRDRPGFHDAARDEVEVEEKEVAQKWRIGDPVPLRYQGDMIKLDDVSFRYNSRQKFILTQISLGVSQNARIAILGANGYGKSTLLSLLTGKLQPTSGIVQWPGNAKISLFSQHNAEAFLTSCTPETTPVSLLLNKSPGKKESDARAHLGGFGIKGAVALSPLSFLSGGELTRLALALHVFDSIPHILILDEPTNHLDILSIDSLIGALLNYKGALVISSHDQYFISQVTNEIYSIENSKLKYLDNGIQDYIKSLSKRKKKKT